jgi:hypothetical protein
LLKVPLNTIKQTNKQSNTVFLCLLNALVHRTHPLSSPKNLEESLVPIYRTQGDSVKHSRQKSSFKQQNTACTTDHVFVNKTTDLSQVTDKLYHIMLYTSPWSRFELTTSVVIGTDCIGSCKSNYDHAHDSPVNGQKYLLKKN